MLAGTKHVMVTTAFRPQRLLISELCMCKLACHMAYKDNICNLCLDIYIFTCMLPISSSYDVSDDIDSTDTPHSLF